jgi:hypothetical protein
MAVAYKIPLSESYRNEFDGLDLRHKKQTEVKCLCQCDARYCLITDEDETAEMIAYYSVQIIAKVGACNQHPPKIVLNF